MQPHDSKYLPTDPVTLGGWCQLGVRDITGIPVYPNLGVLRYVSRYAFAVPVHSANSVNFRSIANLLSFRAVIYLLVNFYLTSLDN